MLPFRTRLPGSHNNLFQVYQRCRPLKSNSCEAQKTHYEVLEVSETATAVEIKKAFIEKSKKLHPDVNPQDPGLHQAFVKVSAAYNTLSNTTARQTYDMKLNVTNTEPDNNYYSYSARSPFGTRNNASQYQRDTKNRWHESDKFHQPPTRQSPVKNPYNKVVVIGALLFMLTGAAVHYFVINYRHQKYKAHVEATNRKAHLAYTETKAKARSNSVRKQLDLLMALHEKPTRNPQQENKMFDGSDQEV